MQNPKLRKIKKELDNETTLNILNSANYGTLALYGENGPYSVPLNYVFIGGEIFFHGAKKGHKMDCIAYCDKACFSVVGKEEIDPDYTTRYQSVCVHGKVERVEDMEEKRDALTLLCKKYYDYSDDYIAETVLPALNHTEIFKLACEYIVGKGVPFN